jgi:alkylhydroperoxidase/carboxymuconolactone decarboxylase family protein YurZ
MVIGAGKKRMQVTMKKETVETLRHAARVVGVPQVSKAFEPVLDRICARLIEAGDDAEKVREVIGTFGT